MSHDYAILAEKRPDAPAPRPPYIGTVVWAQVGDWPFWPSVAVTREWAESQVAVELVRKLPPPSDTNCVVMFFNYDEHIDVVETTNIREFCSSISLVRQAGSYSDDVLRAAQEAIWWLLESGNGTRSQLKAIRDRCFRRSATRYGMEVAPKEAYIERLKKMPKSERKSVFISDDDDEQKKQDPVYNLEDGEEGDDEEEMFIARKKRPQRKARPSKKLVEPSSSSDAELPEASGNVSARRPPQARRTSSKSVRQDAAEVEDGIEHTSAIDLDLDIDDVLNDTNPRLADVNVDELLLLPPKQPLSVAHKPMPVPHQIVKDVPLVLPPVRSTGVQKRPRTVRMSLGSTKSSAPASAPVNRRSHTPDSVKEHERPRKRVRKLEDGRVITRTENRRHLAAPSANLSPRPRAPGNRRSASPERIEAERRPIRPPRAASPATPRPLLLSSERTKAARRPSPHARMSSPTARSPDVRNVGQVNDAPSTAIGGYDSEDPSMRTTNSLTNMRISQLSESMEEMRSELKFVRSLIIELSARELRLEAKHDELAKLVNDLQELQSRTKH